jgi:hypothetical protein
MELNVDLTDELIEQKWGSKPAIIELLISAGRCQNEFTPHESH